MELTNALTLAKNAAPQFNLDIVWTLIAAFLVFFMQAGFAMVEAGFIRAKNTGNVLMKNVLDFAMGAIAFWVLGFGLMFGKDAGGLVGTNGFLFSGATDWTYTFFMFQLVFAATAATIVSGAMAGRTKFSAYLLYSFVVSLVIYPISGHWAWGSLYGVAGDTSQGWLEKLGYIDFAGSGVVHMVGGVLGLVGAIFLGPRIGKYKKDGKAVPIPGHNLPLAALGVFILWFGWYGFNPGSTTAATPEIGYIAMTTTLGAAAGVLGALATSWIKLKVPDIGMTLNGALAGLVAITAPCASVDPWAAALIGLVAGILVVFAVLFIDRVMKIDDPVGAFSVHGIGGAWGVLSAGIFLNKVPEGITRIHQVGVQAIGILAIGGWAALTGIILFGVLKATHGLRVTKEEEIMGLDLGEHKADAYPEFRKDFTKA
jgi:Amt family ammonium transporter